MSHKNSARFRDFYEDDENFSPEDRAEIEFEAALLGMLVEARISSGLTQAQLAESAGVKQSAIARLEKMRTTPRVDTLIKLLTPMGYRLAIVPIEENE